MSYLKEKVAYLRGLAEGMKLDDTTNEGKLLKAIIEIMDDFALTMDDMEEVQEQMNEQIDDIDEDLAEVERVIFDEDETDDDEVCYKEIECPHCHEKMDVDIDAIGDEGTIIKCPSCNKEIEVEWECTCDECEDNEDE